MWNSIAGLYEALRTWRARQESPLGETTEQAKTESILIREATDYFEPKWKQIFRMQIGCINI